MHYQPNPLLYGAHKGFFSSFKLVVTMRDAVDHTLLSQAVAHAMQRYPYFSVKPEKSGESILLRQNTAPLRVFSDDRCPLLGSEETNCHLLAFGCEGRRIFLHASHYIADGMGICPLLLSVLLLYAAQKYGKEGLKMKSFLMPEGEVSSAEYAYPFPKAPLSAEEAYSPTNAYALNPEAFDKEGLYAYHLRIPQAAMMEVANPSDGSPVSFLTVMLYRALCALDSGAEKPIVAHVQHQYRSAIQAPFNRHSLVTYIPVSLSPAIKDRRAEVQNTIVRGQVIVASEPESDLRAVNRLVSVLAGKEGLPLKEKQQAMQKYVEESIRGKTFGISYVGKMDWCGLDPYVEDLHAYIGEKETGNMLLIEVMTVGSDFSLTFMQSGRGRLYVDAFVSQLESLSIPVCLVGEERYTLCDTIIPQ